MAILNKSGFVSAKLLAVYDRNLLERATDNQLFDVWSN